MFCAATVKNCAAASERILFLLNSESASGNIELLFKEGATASERKICAAASERY